MEKNSFQETVLDASSNPHFDSIFVIIGSQDVKRLQQYFNRFKKNPTLLKSRLNSFYDSKENKHLSGITPLIFAIKADFVEMIPLLLANGAEIEKQPTYGDYKGMSPLYVAVINNLPRAVNVLLQNKANPNAVNGDGPNPNCTPLIGCLTDNVDTAIVKMLIESGANNNFVEEGNFAGFNPATVAIKLYFEHTISYENLEAVLKDLKLNLDDECVSPITINRVRSINEFNADGSATYMNLIVAGISNPDEIIKLLKSLHVNFENNPTPLYWAANSGKLDLMRRFIQLGANVNAVIPEGLYRAGETALIAACNAGNLATVQFLIEQHKADVHQICPFGDNKGRNPLSIAIGENIDLIKYLLLQGANADYVITYPAETVEGCLSLAAKSSFLEAVRILLKHSQYQKQVPVEKNVKAMRSLALIYAIQNNDHQIFDLIIDAGVDVNQGCYSNGVYSTDHSDRNLSTVELVKKYYKNQMFSYYSSPFIAAINHNQSDMLKVLLDNQLNINLVFEDSILRGLTPLAYAFALSETKVAKLLIEFGADLIAKVVNSNVYRDWSVLAIGFSSNNIELIKLLVQHITDIDTDLSIGKDSYLTPLMLVILYKNYEAIEYLFHGCNASLNARPKQGVFAELNALKVATLQASINQDYRILFILLAKYLTQEIIDEVNQGSSLLYALAKFKKYDLVKLLLENDYNVDIINRQGANKGETTLYLAIERKDTNLINLLLSYEYIEPELKLQLKKKPKTAIELAESIQDETIIKLLNNFVKKQTVTTTPISEKVNSLFFEPVDKEPLSLQIIEKPTDFVGEDLSQRIISRQHIHPLLHAIHFANQELKTALDKLQQVEVNKKIIHSVLALAVLRKHEAILNYSLSFPESYFTNTERYHQIRNIIMHLFWMVRKNPEHLVNVARSSIVSPEMQLLDQLLGTNKSQGQLDNRVEITNFPANYLKQLTNANNALTILQLQQEILKEINLCEEFAKPITARYKMPFYNQHCQALKMSFTAIGQYVRLLKEKGCDVKEWITSQFCENKKIYLKNAYQFLHLCQEVRRIIGHDFSNEAVNEKSYGFADERIGQADLYGLILAVKRLAKNIDFTIKNQPVVSQQNLQKQ